MKEAIIGLVTGLAVGAVFGLVRANPPAPATIGGVLGVVGIWVGWVLITQWRTL